MNVASEDKLLEHQLTEAWALFVVGRYVEALHLFQAILLIDTDIAMANSVGAACLLSLGHLEEAENYARIGVRLAPQIGLAHTILAQALCANEKYDEAESEYWEAIAANPANPEHQTDLARYLLTRDRTAESRDVLEKLEKSHSENVDAHYLLAICHYRENSNDEALKEIEGTISHNPNCSPAWYIRGLIQLARIKKPAKRTDLINAYREVSESIRRAVELDPEDQKAQTLHSMLRTGIFAIDDQIFAVEELKRTSWQLALAVVALILLAIFDPDFRSNAVIIAAGFLVFTVWRNRKRIMGRERDPFDTIHPMKLDFATAELRAISSAPLVNEWSN